MPEPREGTKVTAQDVVTGENDSAMIVNDYICITDGSCHVAHVQSFANGTHVLTIKGRGRTVMPEPATREHSSSCRDLLALGGDCTCLPNEKATPPATYDLWWCSWCGEPSCEDSNPCQRCGEAIVVVPMVAAIQEENTDA